MQILEIGSQSRGTIHLSERTVGLASFSSALSLLLHFLGFARFLFHAW